MARRMVQGVCEQRVAPGPAATPLTAPSDLRVDHPRTGRRGGHELAGRREWSGVSGSSRQPLARGRLAAVGGRNASQDQVDASVQFLDGIPGERIVLPAQRSEVDMPSPGVVSVCPRRHTGNR